MKYLALCTIFWCAVVASAQSTPSSGASPSAVPKAQVSAVPARKAAPGAPSTDVAKLRSDLDSLRSVVLVLLNSQGTTDSSAVSDAVDKAREARTTSEEAESKAREAQDAVEKLQSDVDDLDRKVRSIESKQDDFDKFQRAICSLSSTGALYTALHGGIFPVCPLF
jgi:peptidoglycan hydrolase CwlO-like protein